MQKRKLQMPYLLHSQSQCSFFHALRLKLTFLLQATWDGLDNPGFGDLYNYNYFRGAFACMA